MKIVRSFLTILLAHLPLLVSAETTWLETSHDFGAFHEEDGEVSTTFHFVNTSDKPMAILRVRTSCGCTSPKYDKGAVSPGDTASIVVTFDPIGRPGKFSKTISVALSDNSPESKLTINGIVIGSAESVAKRYPVSCGNTLSLVRGAVMMGETTKGELKTTYLEAYNRATHQVQPTVENLPPYIRVTTAPGDVMPGAQTTFIIYFDSHQCPTYGLVSDTIYVSAGDNLDEVCPIPVTAYVRENFAKMNDKQRAKAPHVRVESTSLDFGKLPAERVVRTTTIKNTGKSPLKVRRVYTEDAGLTVAVDNDTLKPGAEATILVEVDPSVLPGALLNARITLITNDPDKPETIIRAVGEF